MMKAAEVRQKYEEAAHRASCSGNCVQYKTIHPGHLELLDRVYDAYLAEHPADDDEPISFEWLEAEGWERRTTIVGDRQYWRNGKVLVTDDGVRLEFEELPNITTRGQLRRLIAALKGE
jgi:hypothetical protein